MSAGLRVLIIADSVGGVWQYATELVRALAPFGVRSIIAHLGPGLSRAQRHEADDLHVVETGVPIDWLAGSAAQVAHAAHSLSSLVAGEGIGLVHCNSPALAARLQVDAALVVGAHGCVSTWWDAVRSGVAFDPAFDWHRELTGVGLHVADAVIAPSAAHAAAITRTYALTRPVHIVHNGRTAHPLPAVEPVAGAFTAARLWDAAKRTPLLDAVAARLPVPFRAAGAATGPNRESVRTDHLTLLGTLDADGIAAELARRPVFVSAASFEPFGLAVLEAAQAGCPLVLSDIPVFRELWDGAATFVAGDDPAVWADAIEAELPTSGEAARTRAAGYAPTTMATGVRAIYDQALAARAARRRAS